MNAPAPIPVDHQSSYSRTRIFFVSVLALFTAGLAFSLRADVADEIKRLYFNNSGKLIGEVLGIPFLGFAFTIAIGSPLLDYIGGRIMLLLSGVCFLAGTLTILFSAGSYDIIWLGALISGLGWGLVETVINPVTATLYPNEKTARLNALHAWWPGGLIAGGLLGYFMGQSGASWQMKLSAILVPALLVIILCAGTKFPPTERQAAGISMGEMFGQLLRPTFIVLWLAMFLTAASELAPGQWVDLALTRTVHMQGILLLVYVSGIMFVARHFAGPLVHKLSAIGLLWVSSLLAGLGLVLLSVANSPVTGILAATVWGCGVCFMWPTMLATASERFPRGGALLMGLMGTAGTLSIKFVLPIMGGIYDNRIKAGLDEGLAAQTSFRAVAILPAILLIVFGAIWLYDRSKGGFKAQKL